MTTRILIALIAALTATPALAIDEVTFTAAPDVPMTLQVVETGAAVTTAQIEARKLPADALAGELLEILEASIDCTGDDEAKVVTCTGPAHAVEAAVRLAPELDRRTLQIEFEATVLKVTKKGAKKEVVEGWRELGSWSRAMAREASEGGLVEIVSAPRITTVVDRAASIRDGTCTPEEGAPPSAFCGEGFVHVGFGLQLLPRAVGDRILVEVATIARTPAERRTVQEIVVMDAREVTALLVPGVDGPVWVFLSARIVP